MLFVEHLMETFYNSLVQSKLADYSQLKHPIVYNGYLFFGMDPKMINRVYFSDQKSK